MAFLPSLRDTPERIVPLFQGFLREACERHAKPMPAVLADTLQALGAHPWPGNIRELRTAAERFARGLAPVDGDRALEGAEDEGLPNDDAATGFAVPAQAHRPGGESAPLRERLRAYERALIERELRRCNGSVAKASRRLQMPANTLYYRMKMLGLQADPDAA